MPCSLAALLAAPLARSFFFTVLCRLSWRLVQLQQAGMTCWLLPTGKACQQLRYWHVTCCHACPFAWPWLCA